MAARRSGSDANNTGKDLFLLLFSLFEYIDALSCE